MGNGTTKKGLCQLSGGIFKASECTLCANDDISFLSLSLKRFSGEIKMSFEAKERIALFTAFEAEATV